MTRRKSPITLVPDILSPLTLGERVHKARVAAGHTQRSLATVAGFGGSYSVNRIEQGQTTRLSVEAITRLATALAVTPQYLLGLQPAAAPSLEDQAFYQQYLAQPPQLRATIRRIVAILVKDPPNAG